MVNIQEIILEVADEWDSLEHQDMDTPAAHAVALATEVAKRAILSEREACAKVCEVGTTTLQHTHVNDGKPWETRNDPNGYCATAIRLRSNAIYRDKPCSITSPDQPSKQPLPHASRA